MISYDKFWSKEGEDEEEEKEKEEEGEEEEEEEDVFTLFLGLRQRLPCLSPKRGSHQSCCTFEIRNSCM